MAIIGEGTIKLDLEPTEAAKTFIRAEVLKALKEALGDGKWLEELAVQALEKARQGQKKVVIDDGFRYR